MARAPLQATIERAWQQIAVIEDAFARGDIDQAEWHARMAAIVVPAYVAGDSARAQSGYSGTAREWFEARRMVADAIPRSGSFLDVGCANGVLMESVHAWCRGRGLAVEPYGLEIAPELAALARQRLPQWADRVFLGNVSTWTTPKRFDFVRTGLEYVPRSKRRALVAHLTSNVVEPNGRLLIGPYSEERDDTRTDPSLEDQMRAWSFDVSGRLERPHAHDDRVVRRLLYLDLHQRSPNAQTSTA